MSITSLVEKRIANTMGRYYDPTTTQFTTPDPLFSMTGERHG